MRPSLLMRFASPDASGLVAGNIAVQMGGLGFIAQRCLSPGLSSPSNRIERLRDALLMWTVHWNATDYPDSGQVAKGACMRFEDVDRLMSNFDEIGRRINQPWRCKASIGVEAALERLARLGSGSDERMLSVATERLGQVNVSEGFLSSDHAHARSLHDTLGRLEDFRRDVRGGAFS